MELLNLKDNKNDNNNNSLPKIIIVVNITIR